MKKRKKPIKSTKGYRLYLDSSQPAEKRVKNLLARMTLEEKIGQLSGNFLDNVLDDDRFSLRKFKKMWAEI